MSTFDAARRNSTDSGARASDRHALIEQLLLAGLDHYFVGQYEQAIHVWTRVFFLDRGHARARAYIERARCALAERQREAEARVAEDAVAMRAGGLAYTATSSLGAHVVDEVADVSVSLPRRLSRRDLWRGASEPPATAAPDRAATAPPSRTPGRLRTHVLLVTLATVLLCSAAYVVIARDRLAMWWRSMPVEAPAAIAPVLNSEPLPLPRPSDIALTRAKLLYQRGHLHAAVQALSAVGADDPLRRDADALLADVERALLESAGLRAASPSRTGPGGTAGTAPLSER